MRRLSQIPIVTWLPIRGRSVHKVSKNTHTYKYTHAQYIHAQEIECFLIAALNLISSLLSFITVKHCEARKTESNV